jgi:hypothetical protein
LPETPTVYASADAGQTAWKQKWDHFALGIGFIDRSSLQITNAAWD